MLITSVGYKANLSLYIEYVLAGTFCSVTFWFTLKFWLLVTLTFYTMSQKAEYLHWLKLIIKLVLSKSLDTNDEGDKWYVN